MLVSLTEHLRGKLSDISPGVICSSLMFICFLLLASLGAISHFSSFTDPAEVNNYISFNISSVLALTAGILQAFPQRPGLRRTVVNVSSVFAHQAFPNWVLYCTSKAAREMMFRVLAEEEPDVRVLSYSPGNEFTSNFSQCMGVFSLKYIYLFQYIV